MAPREYLLSYGHAGEFGRFSGDLEINLRRGDCAVVESIRGLELGTVLRASSGGEYQHLLDAAPSGRLVRPASKEDRDRAEHMRHRGEHLFEASRRAAQRLRMPLEVLDAEVLLDGRQAWLHFLRSGECDPRPLMDVLSQEFKLLIILHDLALPTEKEEETSSSSGSCGSGGCGSGGCGSCSSGGCGSCAHTHEEVSTAGRVSLV